MAEEEEVEDDATQTGTNVDQIRDNEPLKEEFHLNSLTPLVNQE